MSSLAIKGGPKLRSTPYPKWPEIGPPEETAMAEVTASGRWWQYSYGKDEFAGTVKGTSRVEEFERRFARLHNVKHAYAMASGSAALEIACRAINLQPGDEVITTPYTFIATSTCILNAHAIPVYVDIDPQTYNIDANLVEAAITKRTRAIIPVHFGGFICDMAKLRAIADRHHLVIIEDAAHAHGASLTGGRSAGSLGDLAIFSLQQSKLLTCGEGGVLTTNNPELAEAAWSLRHYGRTPTGKWYEHFRLGWNYRMTELQGALLLPQLDRMPGQNERRRRNAKLLYGELETVPGLQLVRPHPETDADVYYVLCLRFDPRAWDGVSRDSVVAALIAEGIPAFGGYSFPLYSNPLFQNLDFSSPQSLFMTGRSEPVADFRRYSQSCPVVERVCREESIWLTHDLLLGSEEDTRDIIRGFQKLYENRRELTTHGNAVTP